MNDHLMKTSSIKVKIIRLIFPAPSQKDWRKEITSNIKSYSNSSVEINLRGWSLTCKDIKYLESLCLKEDIKIISIESTNSESIISSSALGIYSFLKLKDEDASHQTNSKKESPKSIEKSKIFVHQGTLRSGEILEIDNDLLILGDVNPGAMVSAGGHVMIWGRLLGIAHAGKNGNREAKITALQLRPVQLRIANKIARGPKERPEIGLAEEAKIENEIIVIKPATTKIN